MSAQTLYSTNIKHLRYGSAHTVVPYYRTGERFRRRGIVRPFFMERKNYADREV